MNKEKWEELAAKVKAKDITPFELGLLTGLSANYDFKDTDVIKTPAVEDKEPA